MRTKALITRFNTRANEWLIDLKKSDSAFLLKKPTEDLWSLAEVYDHVMRVARHYQIPNLKSSMTATAYRKKRKNVKGFAVFNLGVRKNVTMRLEKWPMPIVKAFTPLRRNKLDLIEDFSAFIKEVNSLESSLNQSTRKNKHYLPFFGDIATK